MVAVLVGLVVIGGIKRIASVSERVIPVMVVLYVGFSLVLLLTNLDKIPGAFVVIFRSAFGLDAAAGGMLGAIFIAMQKGIARGIFSNEAGLGFRTYRRCSRSDEGARASGSRFHDRHVP